MLGEVRAVEQGWVSLADRDQDRDRVGHETADGEQQRLSARLVEPVSVVDEQRDGGLLGIGGEQAERRRADREALLGTPGRRARALSSAIACGSGILSSTTSAGRTSSSSDAKGICASDSIPRARRIRMSVARRAP